MRTSNLIFILTVIIAGFSQVNAQIENALSFDGMNDGVQLSPNTHTQITTEGTLEAWINTTANNSGYRGLVVRSTFYGLFLVDNKLSTYIWGGASPGVVTYNGATLNDGQWHHVAFSFKIGVTNGSQMYLDGSPVGPAITLQVGSTPYTFQLGSNTNVQFYNGRMDNVKIWSRALTSEELANPVDCVSNGTTGLVASYSFNSGAAGQNNLGLTTLTDESGLNNNGTLYNFELLGNVSNWVYGYTCPCSTPTGEASQSFCQGAQISNLVVQGQNIQWYSTPTGGTPLDIATPLMDGTTYYATQSGGGCESVDRFAVTATVGGPEPSAPTGPAQQYFCAYNGNTVADLVATGNNIQWYSTSTGGSPLLTSANLTEQWYYASQTTNGCESSDRLNVFVFVTNPTPPTTLDQSQSFCTGATIEDLTGGQNLNWYTASTGGTALASSTLLTNGATYFASKVDGLCESQQRFPVSVQVGPLDLTVMQDGFILTANQNNATYQWIDCNNNNAPIQFETLQSYNAINEGSYAVIVSLPNCSDTSACFPEIAGIEENSSVRLLLNVHPNPAADVVIITTTLASSAQITSSNGAILAELELNGETTVDVSTYAPGMYFIRTAEGQTVKFIKE